MSQPVHQYSNIGENDEQVLPFDKLTSPHRAQPVVSDKGTSQAIYHRPTSQFPSSDHSTIVSSIIKPTPAIEPQVRNFAGCHSNTMII